MKAPIWPAADAPKLEWALFWHEQGWPIVPMNPDTRTPIVLGFGADHEWKPTKADIRKWWRKDPDADIGGRTDGRLVIDADRHDPNKLPFHDGVAAWIALRHELQLPTTMLHRTSGGAGGWHEVYQLNGTAFKTSKLAPGIDIKTGPGKLVRLPGSKGVTIAAWADECEIPAALAARLTRPASPAPEHGADRKRGPFADTPYGLKALQAEADGLAGTEPGDRNNQLNTASLKMGHLVAGGHLTRPTVEPRLLEAARACGLDDREAKATFESGFGKGITEPGGPKPALVAAEPVRNADTERVVPPPDDPLAVARTFLEQHYTDGAGFALLRHWRGTFHSFDGRCWPEDETQRIRAAVYEWLESAVYVKDGGREKWKPTKYRATDVLDAMQAAAHLPARIEAPAWTDDDDDHPPATEIVAMTNGLLHLPTRTLAPHTPALFSQHALAFAFDPDASEPKRWNAFLRELWGDDSESIETLAEVMGYILSGDTSLQKLFLAVGPKRSGKGTIARVVEGLFGAHNVAAPMLSSLTTNFGLQPLVGRPLAVISDARLGTRADSQIAVERLLSISGEDVLTVDRKYREAWTGRIPSRFLILTNELPRLLDSSGALVSRFIVLVMHNSFYGREDPLLTEKLLEEAPGIFNWALEGLDRLRERGHFVQPQAAGDAVRQLEDMSSPVAAFLRERCDVGPLFEVDKQTLFEAWRVWCDHQGLHAGSSAVFGRELIAAEPQVRTIRPGSRDDRRRAYRGVRLQGRLL